MKKIIPYLILLTVMSSCSLSSSDDTFTHIQELLPIENNSIPEVFILGETYEISLTYLRPTDCHAFSDIYYLKYENERTIAIISTIFNNDGNCVDLIDEELEVSFNFKPTELGSYIFKLWKGLDEYDQDLYLIIEVPVN